MSPDRTTLSYELPSPGDGVGSLQFFRFLGGLLPLWYRLFLLCSGLLILVPFAFFDEAQWSIGVFLGFSAPLVFAVIISPILRLRYAADVVRRISIADETLLVETFADDYRYALDDMDSITVEQQARRDLLVWYVDVPGSGRWFRVWVPSPARGEYDRFSEQLGRVLGQRFSQA